LFWRNRDDLSLSDRLRRSYYNLLRDDLEQLLIEKALVESYANFTSRNLSYPFVERRELKPRARIPKIEYDSQNSFLVIFLEDVLPDIHKKYIRFYNTNKTTKTNLIRSGTLPLDATFERTQKCLEAAHFSNFLNELLPVDYALLIQHDPAQHEGRNRYCLTHFHVRIDWPITDAAEDLARYLRYVSKDLYEKGEKNAEDLQKKFFEYHCLPEMIGGRRTAAAVAAQYLRRIPYISTVYAASSESRTLLRYNEQGTTKTVLIKLSAKEVRTIAENNAISSSEFRRHYMVSKAGHGGVFMFQTRYALTQHAVPPEDGKLREIKPENYWLTVEQQLIIPKPGTWAHSPLKCNLIYTG
jgi:hypothetical protein